MAHGAAKHICPTVQLTLTDFKCVHTLISRREQQSDVLQLPVGGNATPATAAVEAPRTCKITDHTVAEFECAITSNPPSNEVQSWEHASTVLSGITAIQPDILQRHETQFSS